jgi:hypothetical protein
MIEQQFLSVKEVAIFTGKSQRTVREWKRLGVLRFVAGRTTQAAIIRAMKVCPTPWGRKDKVA